MMLDGREKVRIEVVGGAGAVMAPASIRSRHQWLALLSDLCYPSTMGDRPAWLDRQMNGATTNSPGELVRVVAAVTGVDETLVTTRYRALREAGLVTKGGRGPSAARPSPRDAATLVVALGGEFGKQPADRIVEDYSAAVAQHGAVWTDDGAKEIGTGEWTFANDGVHFDLPFLRGLPPRHTIIDAVEALIVTTIREGFTRSIRTALPGLSPSYSVSVTFHGPQPAASIEIGLYALASNASASFREEMGYFGAAERSGDLKFNKSITHVTLCAIADLLRPHHYRGCTVDGEPLDPNHHCYSDLSRSEKDELRVKLEAEIDRRDAEEAAD